MFFVGYYARVKSVKYLLDQFLHLTQSNCQVVSLGAGFDSLFWQLKVSECQILLALKKEIVEIENSQ